MNKTDTVAPHPPLTDYSADETARHRWLRTIFNASAVDYDRIEGLMAFGTGLVSMPGAFVAQGAPAAGT